MSGKTAVQRFYYPNQTLLRLAEGTSLTFIKAKAQDNTWLALLKGVIHFISRTPRSLTIKTPFVNASIDGTEFVLKVESNQTNILVFEGQGLRHKCPRDLGTGPRGSGRCPKRESTGAKTGGKPQGCSAVGPLLPAGH